MSQRFGVLRAQVDVAQFQTIVPEDQTLWSTGTLDFNGLPKSIWSPPAVRVYNPLQARGNFFHLTPGALVFDEEALDALGDLFEMAGQILPLRLPNEELFLLNVTACYDVLDHTATSWRLTPAGVKLHITHYAFRPDLMPQSSVFKIPETCRGDVLAHQGRNAPEDQFSTRILQAGLRGLVLDPLP